MHLSGAVNDMNSSLEATVKCSQSTSSSEDLSFDYVFGTRPEVSTHLEGVFSVESDSTNGGRDLVGVEEGSSLVLMELQSSHGEGGVFAERTVDFRSQEHIISI